jgi:ATP-dependent RNA helicase RhlE
MELYAPLQRALAELNYKQPSPIQAKTIPQALEGADILGCADTGTGKTAAFAVPILDYIGLEKPQTRPNQPKALVLAPTRELAIQIASSFKKYGKYVSFRLALVYGGVSQGEQVKALRRGADVLVATPGRLLDLMTQGHIDLSAIEIFVLDEADRMFDMGFQPALKQIVAKLPEERQSLFFSATVPPKIAALASQILFNPVKVTVESKATSAKKIAQSVRFVERGEKLDLLNSLLNEDSVDQVIVFTRTKRGANSLAQKLERKGFRSAAIHGNKTQSARQRALQEFRANKIQVLVATDVAARGIDIDGISHVINYDMPLEPESYVHRIGRTGRAGAEGIAVSFCTSDEMNELQAIEKITEGRLQFENPDARFSASSGASKKSPGRSRFGGSSRTPKNGQKRSPKRSPKRKQLRDSTSGSERNPKIGDKKPKSGSPSKTSRTMKRPNTSVA